MVTNCALLTVITDGIVTTVDTDACALVTSGRVAVALAWDANIFEGGVG